MLVGIFSLDFLVRGFLAFYLYGSGFFSLHNLDCMVRRRQVLVGVLHFLQRFSYFSSPRFGVSRIFDCTARR